MWRKRDAAEAFRPRVGLERRAPRLHWRQNFHPVSTPIFQLLQYHIMSSTYRKSSAKRQLGESSVDVPTGSSKRMKHISQPRLETGGAWFHAYDRNP